MPAKAKTVVDQHGHEYTFNEGMEGVIATTSEICFIDGEKGKLLYRGIPIEELAAHSTFEETSYFLLYGSLPAPAELEAFEQRLKANRRLTQATVQMMKMLPKNAPAMSVLRTVVSAVGLEDVDAEDNSLARSQARAERLIAVLPTIVAAIQRTRKGDEPIEPDMAQSHAANFLYMLSGEVPSDYASRVMDVCLILHAEHGFNASTFTARVVISTLSDLYSAIAAAIGSLKGPLHGGANEGVMKMLREIGAVDQVEHAITARLAAKAKIMGFGHRVYRALDPRAKILKQYSQKLAEQTGNTMWYRMSKKIEEVMQEKVGARGIYPNVDFFSASVYHYLGIEIDLFTPIFAVSRISGWTAHVLEQLQANRLFRPRSVYLGPYDAKYIRAENRTPSR